MTPGVTAGLAAIALKSREIYAHFNNQSLNARSSNVVALAACNGGVVDNGITQPEFMTKIPGGVHLTNIDFQICSETGAIVNAPFNCNVIIGLNVTIHV